MYHTITQSFSAGGGEITMQIVKSASKLTGAFITLYRPPRQGTDPITGYYHPDNYAYKRWNYFYNPMINSRINTSANGAVEGEGMQVWDKNLSWQIQLSNAKNIQNLKVNLYQKHFIIYVELCITCIPNKTV